MDKRELPMLIYLGLIFIIELVAIGLLLLNPKPEFTIYKNECHGEERCYFNCSDGDFFPTGTCAFEEVIVHGVKCEREVHIEYVCELKEVDKMYLNDAIFMTESTLRENPSWIEENCQCERQGFIHNDKWCFMAGDFDGEKVVDMGEEYCTFEEEIKNRPCLRFKCWDYIVEVKR